MVSVFSYVFHRQYSEDISWGLIIQSKIIIVVAELIIYACLQAVFASIVGGSYESPIAEFFVEMSKMSDSRRRRLSDIKTLIDKFVDK